MAINKIQKIFGVGPMGAVISLVLLSLFAWVDSRNSIPILTTNYGLKNAVGITLVILGLGYHFWTFSTLRHWWAHDGLCTSGPFKYVRHPMYAAWISLISPGIAIYLNSWLFVFWVILLHPIWHKLVKKEETIMMSTFGKVYGDYAEKTGRFFPKVLKISH
jgi:protein-S-isoprenylcysteine O-methyltransferase Ste14